MTEPIHPRIFWILEPETAPGRLGMMPRPQEGNKLEDDIKGLKAQGVDLVVCLLEDWEQRSLDLTAESRLCLVHNIEFRHFPIPDFGVPNDEAAFSAFTQSLSKKLDEGKNVVVHCHGGIGRSSMAAAGILVNRGVPIAEVFEKVSRHREHPVPETVEQADFIMQWFRNLERS